MYREDNPLWGAKWCKGQDSFLGKFWSPAQRPEENKYLWKLEKQEIYAYLEFKMFCSIQNLPGKVFDPLRIQFKRTNLVVFWNNLNLFNLQSNELWFLDIQPVSLQELENIFTLFSVEMNLTLLLYLQCLI